MKKKKRKRCKFKIKKIVISCCTLLIIPVFVGVIIGVINLYSEISISNNKSSQFSMIAMMNSYVEGTVGEERVPIYSSNDEYSTLLELSVTNNNDVTIDIKNIIIKVTKYKKLDEFIIENAVGGADPIKVLFWSCNISPKENEYYSIYTGTNVNNTEDISKSYYVAISPKDTGEFNVRIYPDTPGLYEIQAIIEYTYSDSIERKESENIKFIYDPNHNGNYVTNY